MIIFTVYSQTVHLMYCLRVLGVAYVVTNDDTVDIIDEALKEFGAGNVSKEKYEMTLMF